MGSTIGSHYLDVSREPKLRESTPLALMALGTGSVDLEVRGAMSLLENGDKLYFIDKKNAVMDEIDSDDYSYTVTSDGTTILNRFFLMFKSAFSSSEDLVQDETCSIQLYRDGDGASIVSQNAPIRKVIVYLPNGAVYSVVKDLNCDFITVPLPSESKIVLVKVVTDEETKTFKVFR